MKRNTRGFTLIELLIVIAIIGVLLAMIAPAIASTRTRSQAALCMNNMRQIAMAALMYADDNSEVIPNVEDTVNYTENQDVYHCPNDNDPTRDCSYVAWKWTPASMLPGANPSYATDKVLYVESEISDKNNIEGANSIAYRHSDRAIVVFADGRAMSGNRDQMTVFLGAGAAGGGGSGRD